MFSPRVVLFTIFSNNNNSQLFFLVACASVHRRDVRDVTDGRHNLIYTVRRRWVAARDRSERESGKKNFLGIFFCLFLE